MTLSVSAQHRKLKNKANQPGVTSAETSKSELATVSPAEPEVPKEQQAAGEEIVEKMNEVEMTTSPIEATVTGPCVIYATPQGKSPKPPGYTFSSSGSDESCGR